SRRNDAIRNWLLERIEDIVRQSDALRLSVDSSVRREDRSSSVHIFNDRTSNLTFSPKSSLSVAHTGLNIIVYIRGTEDEPGEWWKTDAGNAEKYGVLVNAHYDSVPSGYGATDDGVGVVSILQLISYFTHPDHTPTRGIVALLNNGEEDYLN